MGVREGIWGCCRWHLVHICPRSCSYLFQTCCILSICGMVMLLRSLMVMIWLKIEKGDKRCQLSSPPHPGCQVEEECVGFNFVFCFNTFPHLAPKGPPVVLPSQVIMVPCVFGWAGAFSLKESLWRNLCLFQRQHHHCNNLEILFWNQYKARHNWFALFFSQRIISKTSFSLRRRGGWFQEESPSPSVPRLRGGEVKGVQFRISKRLTAWYQPRSC